MSPIRIFTSPAELFTFVSNVVVPEIGSKVAEVEIEEVSKAIDKRVYNQFGNTRSLHSAIDIDVEHTGTWYQSDMNVSVFMNESKLSHNYPSYNPNSPRSRDDNRPYDSNYGGNIIFWLEYGQNGITPYAGRFFMQRAEEQIKKKVAREVAKRVKKYKVYRDRG